MELDPVQLMAIAEAAELERQASDMHRRADALLEPVALILAHYVRDRAKDDEREHLESLLEAFPPGYYRAELRTAIYRRYGGAFTLGEVSRAIRGGGPR